jgi:phage terminase large subunit
VLTFTPTPEEPSQPHQARVPRLPSAGGGFANGGFDWAAAIAASSNPFHVAITRYSRAPIAFCREVLKVEPDPWQIDVLRALGRGHTRIAVRSGHGVGKTALAAWAMTWFANTRAPFKIACTAPSAPQLFDVLFPETLKWFAALPDAWRSLWDITSDHIRLKADKECFITARTSRLDQPEALQGVHATHVMLVCDEASGIPEPVFEAAGGSMSSSGAITLLIGNPTRATGFFWRCCTLERDRWHVMRVSSADSPRVSREFVDEMAARYGENSNAYRVRVLGEFPTSDTDTLIPADLVDQAMGRDVPPDAGAPIIWGVDVARFGDDASVLVKRQGTSVIEMPRRWRNLDTMQLAGAIKAEHDLSPNARPSLIVVDVIGVGAGVVDRLHEQNLPVLGLNVGETPSIMGRYARVRDELWVRMREWLATRSVRLPRDDQLRDDLCAPKYSFLSDGRLQVEPKNMMRARGLPSPDAADALMHTFADQGLGVASGMTSGIFDSNPVRSGIAGMEW